VLNAVVAELSIIVELCIFSIFVVVVVFRRSQNLTGRHLKTRKELKMNYETLTKTGGLLIGHWFM